MIGSLDKPPVIVRARWATPRSLLTAIVVVAAVVAAGVALITGHLHWFSDRDPTVSLWLNAGAGIIALVFAAYIVVIRVAGLIKPATLELTPSGIVFRQGWWTRRWAWSDVRNFRVVDAATFNGVIGFDLVGTSNQQTFTRTAQRRAYGVDAVLWSGQSGGMPLVDLATLLNRARDLWMRTPEKIPVGADPLKFAPKRGLLWRLVLGRVGRREFWVIVACSIPFLVLANLAFTNAPGMLLGADAPGIAILVIAMSARLRDCGYGRKSWQWYASIVGIVFGAATGVDLFQHPDIVLVAISAIAFPFGLIFPGVLAPSPGLNSYGPPLRGPDILQVPRP